MRFRLHYGVEATKLIQDWEFREAWTTLFHSCPWATVFQSYSYTREWLAAYYSVVDPIIVTARTPAGQYSGLLCLASAGDTVAPIGGDDSEYQAWLAKTGYSNQFIGGALKLLAQKFGDRTIEFCFTPPKLPLPGVPCECQRVSRPFYRINPVVISEGRLRKSSNRSRVRRLSACGPVSLLRMGHGLFLRHFEQSVAQINERRLCANGVAPFRDSRRAELYLRLSHASVLWPTALMVGDDVASVHFDYVSNTTLILGLIGHAAVYGTHSPGKIHLLMLLAELGTFGFNSFDLTPEGAYKDRFANTHDDVTLLRINLATLGLDSSIARPVLAAAVCGTRHRTCVRSLPAMTSTGSRRAS